MINVFCVGISAFAAGWFASEGRWSAAILNAFASLFNLGCVLYLKDVAL